MLLEPTLRKFPTHHFSRNFKSMVTPHFQVGKEACTFILCWWECKLLQPQWETILSISINISKAHIIPSLFEINKVYLSPTKERDLSCTAHQIFTHVFTHVTFTTIKIQDISITLKVSPHTKCNHYSDYHHHRSILPVFVLCISVITQ